MEQLTKWTADAFIASAVRASGRTLTDYQRAFLADGCTFRSVLKARQTGYSWLFALEALAHAIADGHFSIFVSLNREEAAEKILYARSLYDAMPESSCPALTRAGTYEMRFEGGGRLLSYPCRAPRGKAGASVYLDEMAFHPQSEAVYTGTLPVITHGGRITVASTPNGDRGMFWRVITEPELAEEFSHHRAPWWLAPWLCRDTASALRDDGLETDERVNRYGTSILKRLRRAMDRESFQQEYELRFVDSQLAYITWDEIEANVGDVPLAANWAQLAAMGGPLYAGVDIGRVTHATEIIVLRRDSGGFAVAAMKSMVDTRFDLQEDAILGCLRTGAVERLCLDETGIGQQMAERLAHEFPKQAEGVHFHTESKDLMARAVKEALQNGTLALPRSRALMEQLHAVRRTIGTSGKPRYTAEVRGSNHADKFWALALALQAANGRQSMVRARSVIR